MKTSIIVAAATSGLASATKVGYSGSSYNGYGGSSNFAFVPKADQFVLFADNVQTVSQAYPNTAFLRSTNTYTVTPNDFALASSFTVPDFAYGLNCSLNFAVPSLQQTYGDLTAALFSGSGNLNFSRAFNDFPSSGLTFNNIGPIQSNGVVQIIPGQNFQLAEFPCPPGGSQLPGLISSPAYGADTTVVVPDRFGPFGTQGLFVVIEGVSNPPVSPSSSSAWYSGSHTYGSHHPTGTSYGSSYGNSYNTDYGSSYASDSYATYTSAYHA